MGKKAATKIIVDALVDVMTNKEVKKALLGTYTDGSTRSIMDALQDEIVSPKDREKYRKNKKKKKKSKKNKKVKIDF